MIDSKTISAVIDGNPQAFEKVYLQTHDKAYSIAYRILKDEYEAEDIVQDAYLTMIEKITSLKEADRFEGWFYRIVQNEARDNLRKRHADVFSSFDNDEEDFQFSDTIVSDYTPFDPEATADYEELKRIMDGFVMGLPEMQRKCILLRFRGDKKISEIAQILGIPEATVKSNLNYGKRKIEGEVRALEKQGVKLYSLTPLTVIAFLRWMWGKSSSAKAAAIYAAGTTAAASGSAASGAAASGAAAAAAKTGIVLTAKQIAAGVVAAIVITGSTTALAKPDLISSLFVPASTQVFLEAPTEETTEAVTEEPIQATVPTQAASKPTTPTVTEPTIHEHGEKKTSVVPASCVDEGLKVVICAECGEELESIPIPALGHNYQLTNYQTFNLSATNRFATNFFVTNLSATDTVTEPVGEEAPEAEDVGGENTAPATEPGEETTSPTEPTTEPGEETTSPTEPTTEPGEETTPPTEPATEPPTEPATEPREETTSPTEPTTEAEEETTPPTEPGEETTPPTEPTTEPGEETTPPTEPREETTPPTEPTTEPEEETTPPTEPREETTSPTEPTTEAEEETTPPTEPREETTSPTEPTTEAEEETMPPTAPTTEAEEETTPPTEPSTEPRVETTSPTEPGESNEAVGWYEYTCTRCGSVYRTYTTGTPPSPYV